MPAVTQREETANETDDIITYIIVVAESAVTTVPQCTGHKVIGRYHTV